MAIIIHHHDVKQAKREGLDAHMALKQYELLVDGVPFDRLPNAARAAGSMGEQAQAVVMPGQRFERGSGKPMAATAFGRTGVSTMAGGAGAAGAAPGSPSFGGAYGSAAAERKGSVEVNTMSFDKFVSTTASSSRVALSVSAPRQSVTA